MKNIFILSDFLFELLILNKCSFSVLLGYLY